LLIVRDCFFDVFFVFFSYRAGVFL
jgi:hypothetical protein